MILRLNLLKNISNLSYLSSPVQAANAMLCLDYSNLHIVMKSFREKKRKSQSGKN